MTDNLLELIKKTPVEWKPLGEVGEFIRGNGMQKKDFVEDGFPAIHYGQIYTRYGLEATETFTFVSKDLAHRLRIANKDDLLIATTSENDEDVCKPLAWLGHEVAISGDMMLFRHNENVKYLAHYFLTENFQVQKQKYINGTKVRRVSGDNLSKILIPIPPKEIQEKIVELLDKMTKYVKELTKELTMRNKQYAYYRDLLLSEESLAKIGFEWKKLEEVGEFIRGNGMQKKDFVEDGFPAIHYGQIYTKYGLDATETFNFVSEEFAQKLRIANNNDLLIATTSENDEDVCKPLAWTGGEVAISGDMMLFRHNENVKYLAHYFQTEHFQTQKRKYISGTKVRRVSGDNLSKISIAIPSQTEQFRIVTILDKFDALTTSLTEGLPKEIELRQKQYEYYRELLLGFGHE